MNYFPCVYLSNVSLPRNNVRTMLSIFLLVPEQEAPLVPSVFWPWPFPSACGPSAAHSLSCAHSCVDGQHSCQVPSKEPADARALSRVCGLPSSSSDHFINSPSWFPFASSGGPPRSQGLLGSQTQALQGFFQLQTLFPQLAAAAGCAPPLTAPPFPPQPVY